MWVATHLHSGSRIYLLSGKGYTIGRVGSDIVLSDDTSISRSHAVLEVFGDSIKLEDKGSKYGTYYNEHIDSKQKLPKGKPVALKEGDRVLFGALKNEWLISKNNINTMVSSLNSGDSAEVKKYLDILGGNIISTWESRCTHLTMTEITITIKVLHALIEKIPIVSCTFWKDYLKNIQEKKEPPNPSKYMPKRSLQLSSAIQDKHLAFNENRKTLFAGKTFVFMTKKHFDMYSPIVMKAGGQCKDLKNNNVSKAFLARKNTVVVQYVASTQSQGTQTINTISEYLESKNLRTIPEYEIGLAIICCTTEKYCNPSFSTILNILPETASETPNIGTMLAENTRSQKSEIGPSDFTHSDIPESSNYSRKKPAASKTAIRSEVYDSEVITIESQNSMDCLSSIPESDVSLKSKDNFAKNDVRDVNFSDDDFSENLILSSDVVSNENPQPNETRKRPTTPIDNAQSKKPRTSTSLSDERQEEAGPVASSSLASSKKNTLQINLNIQSKPVLPGFLQKSQITNTQREAILEASQQAANRSVAAGKRGRIALINDNDSDDDDDDLFNFGSSPKKSKRSGEGRTGGDCVSDEEELFAFGGGNKSRSDEVDRVEREHPSVAKENGIANKKSSFDVRSKIKVSPIKAEPGGWLSALSILKIKDEDEEVKDEKNTSEDDAKRKEWIDSLKEGFEVRVRKMNLLPKGSNISVDQETSNSSLNTTKKNFKAFVKKRNYKSQTLIIPTFKTVVPPV